MAPRLTSVPTGDAHFDETEVEIGGLTYRLRELTAGEYDEALSVSTKEDGDVDMVMMVKLMLIKSIVEPPLRDSQLAALPYKTSRTLKRAVSDLHWADEQAAVSEAAEDEDPNR